MKLLDFRGFRGAASRRSVITAVAKFQRTVILDCSAYSGAVFSRHATAIARVSDLEGFVDALNLSGRSECSLLLGSGSRRSIVGGPLYPPPCWSAGRLLGVYRVSAASALRHVWIEPRAEVFAKRLLNFSSVRQICSRSLDPRWFCIHSRSSTTEQN